MAMTQLPAPCKFEREANGHFYLWDGTFRPHAIFDLNDPQLGLGNAVNQIFADLGQGNLTAIFVPTSKDSYFQTFLNFLAAS